MKPKRNPNHYILEPKLLAQLFINLQKQNH